MSTDDQRKAEVLRRKVIDPSGPGSILRDFESLLELIGADGLRSTGKYHLLPLDRLRELDERMTRPLRPRLGRPQQRSFPHLNGLYLLLRATRLGLPKGVGKKTGRLVLDPAVLDQWRALNWTERYFNLLEAWLRLGRTEMLGERGGGWLDTMLREATRVWRSVPKKGIDFRKGSARDPYWLYGTLSFCSLALFELFGLLDVERGEPAEGENWRILRVRRTAFGEALMDNILVGQFNGLLHLEEEQPDLGAWQRLFQEDFPDWRNNLKFPEPEYRDGVYYFKVRLGRPWRRIAIPADHDLEALAWWIIDAFEFDGDHLYGFSFRERDGSEVTVEHPYVDEARAHTDEYSIGYLPLEEGQSMKFLYDYGANWQFDVKLEEVQPPDRRMTEPRIVESRGKAPEEYDF